MRRIFRDYGLSIVLAVLFLASLALQATTGWVEFVGEQAAHGQQSQLFGGDGYIWAFFQATFENWQSEFLQLFTMVVLTAFLIHRGASESMDSDEEMRLMLNRIERRIMDLEARGGQTDDR